MATTRVRLWRWRDSPLRRRSDRLEGWLTLGAALVFAVGGTALGWLTASAVDDDLNSMHTDRQRTTAVLLQDAVLTPLAEAGAPSDRVWADVRWTAADGSRQTGQARVGTGDEKGSRTVIWTDATGRDLVREPPTAGEAAAQSGVAGTGAALGVGGLVLGCRYVLRLRLDRQRAEEWERDWERVEPQWRQGSSGSSSESSER